MSMMLSGVAYAADITAAAQRHHLDPTLLAAVAAQETGGPGSDSGRNIVGDGGHGRGLFQIDDRFHAFARSADAMNPAANAEYAADMLSGLVSRYGDVHRALSAYNAGDPNAQGTVTTWNDGRRLGYADSVLRHYANLEKKEPSMSSFLGHIVHGIESGVGALVATGNPMIAAGAGIAGTLTSGAGGRAAPQPAPPIPSWDGGLLESLKANRHADAASSTTLSAFADMISSSTS